VSNRLIDVTPVQACTITVRGVVQGVGFRPFVYRLAEAHMLTGWVCNIDEGVEVHLEGDPSRLAQFVEKLSDATAPAAPPAARITAIDVKSAQPTGARTFSIRSSREQKRPTVRMSPDLAVCDACVREIQTPGDRRFGYPYNNCTECGPRYSIIQHLPYDRSGTTMSAWALDDHCAREYQETHNRRFHAQPVACPACGPHYYLLADGRKTVGDAAVIHEAANRLCGGQILAVKGIGGYHLACDATNATAVHALRARKFRKEKPFAVMVADVKQARQLVELSDSALALLTSTVRPIVLAPARILLQGVAPETAELGLMLPNTPLHYLLFDADAPSALVMTSANRSSEPIAYEDDDALDRLSGIADAFLVGERPVARRIDDSVVRMTPAGPMVLRRSRGYAPGAVATLPVERPILALGADLKNTITLVVDGQAFVSQHIGDLDHYPALRAFRETIDDLMTTYQVRRDETLVVRDCHPHYRSSQFADDLGVAERRSVQHHRAHVASVLAERQAFTQRVVGVSFDGTGYGDDGTIWGGEFFLGSLQDGFQRVAQLRTARLIGGDAAARYPVQAAAGFLEQLEAPPDFTAPPFGFDRRFRLAQSISASGARVFPTTSVGRLFDAAAAALGFTRETTFEGQAAIWLENQARTTRQVTPYPFPFTDAELDFRPLLQAVVEDRLRRRAPGEIARAFHSGVAHGVCAAVIETCKAHQVDTVVASGGVFQNALLLDEVQRLGAEAGLAVWINHEVPPNDGGISLGQAALAAHGNFDVPKD
jgi:hydrogenase maturation protein HypF